MTLSFNESYNRFARYERYERYNNK